MTTYNSDQLTKTTDDQTRVYPIDGHGKLRMHYFKYTNNTAAPLVIADEIDLFWLPFGRLRVLPALSRFSCTALGAARTLSIGHRAYTKDESATGTVALDAAAFISVKDVSAAVNDVAFDGGAGKLKYDLYSKAGIKVHATLAGGTFPIASSFEGYMIYVAD